MKFLKDYSPILASFMLGITIGVILTKRLKEGLEFLEPQERTAKPSHFRQQRRIHKDKYRTRKNVTENALR